MAGILALCFNGGGSEQTLSRVAGMFVGPGGLLSTNTEQDGTVSTSKTIDPALSQQKPLVVLISKGTVSGAEIFARSLRDLGRATLVGDPTAGCTDGGLQLGLLDGSGVFVATISTSAGPAAVNLQNVGVKPDVSVLLMRSDVANGRDLQVDAGRDVPFGPVRHALTCFAPAPTGPRRPAGRVALRRGSRRSCFFDLRDGRGRPRTAPAYVGAGFRANPSDADVGQSNGPAYYVDNDACDVSQPCTGLGHRRTL